MSETGIHIEIQEPRCFTARAVFIVCAFGVLLVLPVLLSMLVVSSVQFGILTALIPLAVICVATLFLPFGFGNTYVARPVRSFKPAAWKEADCFVVQITMVPRIRSGWRALLEDADDIGNLHLGESELLFLGDSARLTLPYTKLGDLRLQTIGLRGLFVYPRLAVGVSGFPGIREVRIAQRDGWFLPSSRKRTQELYDRLKAQVRKASGLSNTS